MKKFKQMLAASLISVVTLSMTACSSAPTPSPNEQNNQETEAVSENATTSTDTSQETAEEETPTEEEELGYDPNLDLGGYEYVIASFYGSDVWHPEEGKSEIGDLMLERYRQIEEENNCKITFIDCTPDEMIDAINTSAATGTKYADQIHVNMDMYSKLMRAGYIVPVDELPYIDIEDEKWNQYYYDITTGADGKLYGLDFLSWPNRKPYPDQCVFFNKTLIKELGLPDPYELYDKGEWTWDTFRQLLKDATRDTNGDGEMDIYGITCVGNLLEYSALYSNGVHTYDIVDDKYQFNMENDTAYKALQFTSDIRNVDKTFKSLEPGSHWGLPLDTFKEHGTVFFMRDVIYFQDVKENDHEFGMLPFPKGPDLTGKYPTASWNGDTQVQSILQAGNDVDKAAYIFNRITEPFEEYPMGAWEDYALRNHFMKDEKAFEIFKEMCENAYPDGISVYGGDVSGKISQALTDASTLVKTPAEALRSVAEEAQTYLDDTLNK